MVIFNVLRHPAIREWLVILTALCLLTYLAQSRDWLSRIDQTLYDQALELHHRPAQDDIVIIGIDEASLAQIGRWPWPRNVHATLINQLTQAGAKVVLLDVILTETDKANVAGSVALGDAIQTNGHVILPVVFSTIEGAQIESLPIASIANGVARLSHIKIVPDGDGVVRGTYLQGGLHAATYDVSSLAALMVSDPARWNAKTKLPGETSGRTALFSRFWVGEHWYRVPFAGPPGHFKTIPYIDVLRGDHPLDDLRGKIVLVGATASALTDEFPTPSSGGTRAMPGIEIQANILQGLRENIDIRQTSATMHILITLSLLLILMLSYLWLSPRRSLVLTGAMILLAVAAALAIFRFQYVWISPVAACVAMLLAYPLWSWRKLEATQRYFDAELARLEREPSIVPQEAAQAIAPQMTQRFSIPGSVERSIAALQSTAQRMRNINRFVADSLESLPQAAMVTDANGSILLANSSADRLFKSRRQRGDRPADPSLEGREIFAIMSAFRHEQGRSWRDLWMNAHEETQTISVEAKGPDDHEVLVHLAPLFSARGAQTGSIVTIIDISPLRESERRRDEALRFLSHDMRSPQASILTLLDMYAHDAASMSVEKLTERIGKYARRTLNLADDFLRLAKAERAKPQDFDLVDLIEVLRDATEEAWSLATTKNIHIETEPAVDEAMLSGDRDLLTRGLINLLSNAIKYSPPNTTVRCRVCAENVMWRIDIVDQGYGILEADMSRLFSRFARLQHEGQPEEAGIGLGLVFVKTVIERHGGGITVKSKVAVAAGDEHGTVFSLTLPMSPL